jgi:hypothetical protein
MLVLEITAIWHVTQCSVTESYQLLIEPDVLVPAETAENGTSRFLPTPAYSARLNVDTRSRSYCYIYYI